MSLAWSPVVILQSVVYQVPASGSCPAHHHKTNPKTGLQSDDITQGLVVSWFILSKLGGDHLMSKEAWSLKAEDLLDLLWYSMWDIKIIVTLASNQQPSLKPSAEVWNQIGFYSLLHFTLLLALHYWMNPIKKKKKSFCYAMLATVLWFSHWDSKST